MKFIQSGPCYHDFSALHPDSKIHWVNMGPTWVQSAPDGPHVGPMNLAKMWMQKHLSLTSGRIFPMPQYISVVVANLRFKLFLVHDFFMGNYVRQKPETHSFINDISFINDSLSQKACQISMRSRYINTNSHGCRQGLKRDFCYTISINPSHFYYCLPLWIQNEISEGKWFDTKSYIERT